MTTERRYLSSAAAGFKVTDRDDGGKTLAGYAAVFHREGDPATEYELWEGTVERIGRGAFDRALRERHDARALFNHNPDNLLGRVSAGTVTLSVDEVGLRYEIPFDPDDPDHQRVLRKIERGDLSGSSFAFVPTETLWSEVDGAQIRTILDADLYDVGPVTSPAYTGTSATSRADGGSLDAIRAEWETHQQDAEAVRVRNQKIAFGDKELSL